MIFFSLPVITLTNGLVVTAFLNVVVSKEFSKVVLSLVISFKVVVSRASNMVVLSRETVGEDVDVVDVDSLTSLLNNIPSVVISKSKSDSVVIGSVTVSILDFSVVCVNVVGEDVELVVLASDIFVVVLIVGPIGKLPLL